MEQLQACKVLRECKRLRDVEKLYEKSIEHDRRFEAVERKLTKHEKSTMS